MQIYNLFLGTDERYMMKFRKKKYFIFKFCFIPLLIFPQYQQIGVYHLSYFHSYNGITITATLLRYLPSEVIFVYVLVLSTFRLNLYLIFPMLF